MEKSAYKAKLNLAYSTIPSPDLVSRIEARIAIENARIARQKAYGFGALSLASVVALIPAGQFVFGQSAQSGLYEYLSLFFTDSGYVFANIKEVLMSVAESVPVMGTALTLASLLVIAYAAGKSASYIRSSQLYAVSKLSI